MCECLLPAFFARLSAVCPIADYPPPPITLSHPLPLLPRLPSRPLHPPAISLLTACTDMAYQFPAPLLVSPEDRMKVLQPIEDMINGPGYRTDIEGLDAVTANDLGIRQSAVVRATRTPVS